MIYIFTLIIFLWSATAEAATRYVDSTAGACTGNYSIANRNCTGSDGNSYATITLGIAAMSAGDITYVRGGTYTDGNLNLPAGVSVSVPSVLQAYQDDEVIVRPSSGLRVIYTISRPYIKYWNLELDGQNATSDVVKVETASHYFVLGGDMTAAGAFRCKVHNSGQEGISMQGLVDNGTITGCDIYDNGLSKTVAPYAHGLYLQRGVGWTFTKNTIRRNGCYGFQANGSTHPVSLTFSRNLVYDNARTSGCGIQAIFNGTGHTVEYSAFWNDLETGNTVGARISSDNTTIRHVSFYNAGTTACLQILSSANATAVQNVVALGCGTGISDSGVSTTLTDNLTSGTASSIFKSIVSGSIDLSLKAGSAPIDGGTAIGGTANGAPDQGVHEVPTFSSCTVEAAATSVVRVTFTNNLRPPMLPSSGVTGVTFRKNGSNNAVVSSTKISDNMYGFTVTNSYAGGDTVDISIVPASTNLTDSALIGGTNNQPFVDTVTNTACTNNAAGVIYTYTQARYEHHDWRGLENAPVILPHGFPTTGAAENFSNLKVRPLGKIRTRFAIVCGGSDCPSSSFHPYVSTGGAYASILDDFSVHNIKMCGVSSGSDMSANGSVSTNQLSTAGTFTAGGIVFTSNGTPEVTGLNNGYKTELEYCFEFDSDASGNFDIRVYLDTGTELDTYTVTPRLVIEPAAAGAQ